MKRQRIFEITIHTMVVTMLFVIAGLTGMASEVEGWNLSSLTSRKIYRLHHLSMSSTNPRNNNEKGKLLVLGGTGFLGQTVCRRALLEGYTVTSLSRRGQPPSSSSDAKSSQYTAGNIDYRTGDAREMGSISNILAEGGYVGM